MMIAAPSAEAADFSSSREVTVVWEPEEPPVVPPFWVQYPMSQVSVTAPEEDPEEEPEEPEEEPEVLELELALPVAVADAACWA